MNRKINIRTDVRRKYQLNVTLLRSWNWVKVFFNVMSTYLPQAVIKVRRICLQRLANSTLKHLLENKTRHHLLPRLFDLLLLLLLRLLLLLLLLLLILAYFFSHQQRQQQQQNLLTSIPFIISTRPKGLHTQFLQFYLCHSVLTSKVGQGYRN